MERVDENGDLISIGEMARSTRLTVKALRWYAEVDVLEPAFVDPDSGYRYYRPEQVRQARLVGLLRGLDMPLPQVAEFLASPSRERLRSWWGGQAAEFARREGLVRYLEITLSEGAAPMFEIQTREAPQEKVVTLTVQVLQPDLPRVLPDAIDRLRAHVTAQGATAKPFDLVLYHSDMTPDVEGTVEVCVPFEGSLEPAADLAVRIEPARTEAFARVTKGQFATLEVMHAFDAVGAWLGEHGHAMTAAPREVYFADWGAIGDDEPAADVAFPFAP